MENDLHPIAFREMIEDFSSLAADDTDLDVEEGSVYAWGNRSICDLFDFSSSHWAKEHGRRCSNRLDEELDFYEFLSNHDIDSAGVEESQFCDYR